MLKKYVAILASCLIIAPLFGNSDILPIKGRIKQQIEFIKNTSTKQKIKALAWAGAGIGSAYYAVSLTKMLVPDIRNEMLNKKTIWPIGLLSVVYMGTACGFSNAYNALTTK